MGTIIPFRKPRQKSRWTKANAYVRGTKRAWFARRPGSRTASRSGRWFAFALVIVPLSAFSAVLLLPLGGGPEEADAADARLAALQSRRSAADLDAEQPQIAVAGGGAGAGTGAASTGDRERANFGLCSGAVRSTCVVDGDTIWYRGTKIRIADLDTPEVSKPGCANEAMLGRKATLRLQALLNAGPFNLEPNAFGPSVDKYGRRLMLVTRGGESLGAVLVDEGLAEAWGGPRRAWC